MVGQEAQFLDDVVDSELAAEEGVEEAEQVDETYTEDENSRLGAADQQSCAEGENPIEEPFLAVVFSPGLDTLS